MRLRGRQRRAIAGRQFVDEAQVGSGEHGARVIQLGQQRGQRRILGAAGLVQQAHGQRSRRWIGQQASVAAVERLEQAASGLGIVQLRCQHRRHRGLGPVGQHAQCLHQQAQRRRQRL